jgi:hypothetical protein
MCFRYLITGRDYTHLPLQSSTKYQIIMYTINSQTEVQNSQGNHLRYQ